MPNPLAADLDHVLAHTSGVWDELRGARLFITGGTGFFGCWLLETFAWACDTLGLDATATVLTRSPEGFCAKAPHLANHAAIRLHRGHVQGFEYPSGKFTHVIQAASDSTPALCKESPLLVMDTIVNGTRRVLDFAASTGVKRVLFTSSGAVYGKQPADVTGVRETYTGAPDCADASAVYAQAKRAAEQLCAIYAQTHGLECLIARCFAFVGPYLPLDAHFAIGNFINDMLHDRPIQVNGDGTPYRSYLYAADLAIWLWTILVKGQSVRPYNVGSEQAITIAETAQTVASAIGSPHSVQIAHKARPGVAASRYVPSTARAHNELQLRQWISLEEAIRRTAAACTRPAAKGEAA